MRKCLDTAMKRTAIKQPGALRPLRHGHRLMTAAFAVQRLRAKNQSYNHRVNALGMCAPNAWTTIEVEIDIDLDEKDVQWRDLPPVGTPERPTLRVINGAPSAAS
jgi:hypothetical protein